MQGKDEKFDFLYDKALAVHQKIAMMLYAKNKFLEMKKDYESTQNMDAPVLYGMGKTELLFYFESMIVFARNALDVASFVYSDLFSDQRIDSFNKFIKKVKKSEDSFLENLKRYYIKAEGEMSALRMLCGSEKVMKDSLEYKGYHAKIEFDSESYVLRGKRKIILFAPLPDSKAAF